MSMNFFIFCDFVIQYVFFPPLVYSGSGMKLYYISSFKKRFEGSSSTDVKSVADVKSKKGTRSEIHLKTIEGFKGLLKTIAKCKTVHRSAL